MGMSDAAPAVAVRRASPSEANKRGCHASLRSGVFIIAIVAAIFGFGGIAVGAAGIAKVLFVLFLIGAVIALVAGRPWA
jgi:uncharacterized membrane protein YtjA (UPF0391 family)